MVWSQYVYEASANTDVIPSDEEELEDDVHLSVEDWQIKYSDELWALWDIIQQLLRDGFLEHTLLTDCDFSDFAEFCYNEHTDECDFVWFPYEFHLSYIWKHIDTYLEYYPEFMVGATFDHWVRFVYEHTKQNNMSI